MRRRDEGIAEKGIDVELALDVVEGAIRREFDVGVIFSMDADLEPAIEHVQRFVPALDIVIEVAAWSGVQRHPTRIGPHERVWCHWLGLAEYERVRDRRNYTLRRRKRR